VKLLVQRVRRAAVRVGTREVSRIGCGLLLFLGIEKGDLPEQADWLARKAAEIRIFPDDQGLMNRDLASVQGEVLVVSQFTLAGELRRGRRPGFDRAAPPEEALPLYRRFVDELRSRGVTVREGEFRASMEVELVNWGPVTLMLTPPDSPPAG